MKFVFSLFLFCALCSATANAQSNQCLSFDGATAYGEVGVSSAPVQNATYECWVKIDQYVTNRDAYAWTLARWGWWDTGMPSFSLKTGEATGIVGIGHSQRTAPGTIREGTWHHLATVTDGNSSPGYDLYVDGQLVLSEGPTQNVPGSTWTLCLGAINFMGWREFYLGEIDEARISTNRRYSSNFIPERRLQTDAFTYGLWHFDEGSGSTASDSSGNDRHFNLHGGFSWKAGNDPAQPTYNHTAASAGQNLNLSVTSATPGAIVYFCYSLQGPGPTTINGGAILDLSVPIHGGLTPGWGHITDASGNANMSVIIPARMSGATVWSQVLENNAGAFRISNLATTVVQ
ncbi:MAG: hypothetical protein QM477_08835 [Planctomycetota bacterium]